MTTQTGRRWGRSYRVGLEAASRRVPGLMAIAWLQFPYEPLQRRGRQNRLSELIDRALHGEDVIVTRHGAPVVELRAVTPGPRPARDTDIDWLASRRLPARPGFDTASESLAALRDGIAA